jgi:hypothetical protein
VTEGQTRTQASKEIIEWYAASHMCHGIVVLVSCRPLEVGGAHNNVEYKELREGKFGFNLNGSYKNVFPDLCVDELKLKFVRLATTAVHTILSLRRSLSILILTWHFVVWRIQRSHFIWYEE